MTNKEIAELIFNQRLIDGEALIANSRAGMIITEIAKAINGSANVTQAIKAVTAVADLGMKDLVGLISETAYAMAANAAPITDPSVITKAVQGFQGLGGKLEEQLDTWATASVSNISNEMMRLNQLGTSTDELRDAMVGIKVPGGKYEGGFLNSLVSNTERQSRTQNKMAEQVGADAERRKNGAIGYEWVSVLDSRTSGTCMALDGKQFFYNRSGAKPIPPQHPNCRSGTMALYANKNGTIRRDKNSLKGQETDDGSSYDPNATVKSWIKDESEKQIQVQHKDGTTTYAWECKDRENLKYQESKPDGCVPALGGEARTAMGETRWKLYTDGKLKIERFTDAGFQPLNLDQIGGRSELAFIRAGVEIPDAAIAKLKAIPKKELAEYPVRMQIQIARVTQNKPAEIAAVKTQITSAKAAVTKAAANLKNELLNAEDKAKAARTLNQLKGKQNAAQNALDLLTGKPKPPEPTQDTAKLNQAVDEASNTLDMAVEEVKKAMDSQRKAQQASDVAWINREEIEESEYKRSTDDPGIRNLDFEGEYEKAAKEPFFIPAKGSNKKTMPPWDVRRKMNDSEKQAFAESVGTFTDGSKHIRAWQWNGGKAPTLDPKQDGHFSTAYWNDIERAVNDIEAGQTLYRYDNTKRISRGLEFNETKDTQMAFHKQLMDMKPGETYLDQGTSSWSRDESTAITFADGGHHAIILEITPKAPMGHFIAPVSTFTKENEVLIRAGQEMVMKSRTTMKNGMTKIVLEELPTKKISTEYIEAAQVKLDAANKVLDTAAAKTAKATANVAKAQTGMRDALGKKYANEIDQGQLLAARNTVNIFRQVRKEWYSSQGVTMVETGTIVSKDIGRFKTKYAP